MSKISRIRILNLNYNNNTIKIDDETFDLGGQNTLISLRNGGGKSVLVQMIVSLFVNRTYRDFGDRPFKSYFTTNRPTFLMTEWILDNGIDRFLAGMMVRKNQKEDNDTEELEMYTFTGSYSNGCKYDLDNLPIIRQDGNKKILKGFFKDGRDVDAPFSPVIRYRTKIVPPEAKVFNAIPEMTALEFNFRIK